MQDEKPEYGLQQFNAADLLKRNTVTQVFKTLDDACSIQETISENSFETSFTKRVDLVEGLLWKYTPPELRKAVKDLHEAMDKQLQQADEMEKVNPKNLMLTKKKIAYNYCIEIFKLLEVVLTNSPISVEYAEMEVTGDFKELIENIRQEVPVKIFATEVNR
jgi:DNA-binding transcriptional regulator GbsR (MarR family)